MYRLLLNELLKETSKNITNFNTSNINSIVLRVRPLNHKEQHSNDPMVTQFPGNGQILVIKFFSSKQHIAYFIKQICLGTVRWHTGRP